MQPPRGRKFKHREPSEPSEPRRERAAAAERTERDREPPKKEEATMPRFEVGQRIHFRPFTNKALKLTGTIKQISEDQKVLTVTAEADGKTIEVERDFEALAEDSSEAD